MRLRNHSQNIRETLSSNRLGKFLKPQQINSPITRAHLLLIACLRFQTTWQKPFPNIRENFNLIVSTKYPVKEPVFYIGMAMLKQT